MEVEDKRGGVRNFILGIGIRGIFRGSRGDIEDLGIGRWEVIGSRFLESRKEFYLEREVTEERKRFYL